MGDVISRRHIQLKHANKLIFTMVHFQERTFRSGTEDKEIACVLSEVRLKLWKGCKIIETESAKDVPDRIGSRKWKCEVRGEKCKDG